VKKISKSVFMFLFVILLSGIFTNCLTYWLIEDAVDRDRRKEMEDIIKKNDAIKTIEAEIGRKKAVNERLSPNGLKFSSIRLFGSKAEDRLTRRTSSLAGGVPVDISPYIFHSESFAVMNNEIHNCKLIIPNLSLGASINRRGNIQKEGIVAMELDITVTFNFNNNQYKNDESIFLIIPKDENRYLGNYLKSYSVNIHHGLKLNAGRDDLKNFDVKINNTRNNKEISFYPNNPNRSYRFLYDYSVYDTEPCYYMFDVEVEYKKTSYTRGQPSVYETINKVYRSDYSSLAGAAFDVHTAISDDTKDLYPIINFVKVVKYPLP